MESVYQNLKQNLQQVLCFFRLKLLLYNLMGGGIVLFFSFMVLLFLYDLVFSFFQLTVLTKTVLYYSFVILLVVEFLIFLLYPVFRFILSLRLANDLLLRQILKFPFLNNDVFVSVYNLAFHSEKITGDRQLKEAAFIQKQNYLKDHCLPVVFPGKLLFRRLALLVGLLVVLFFNYANFSRLYSDLKNYEDIRTLHEVRFMIQNESLSVEYGKSFALKLKVDSDHFSVENVFICFGGGEFLMRKSDSLFVYDFDVVNNDIKFSFKALDSPSSVYKIVVLPSPVITNYKVTSIPPRYTGLNTEIQTNTVDFRVLYGSSLKFELDFSDVDSLYLEEGNNRFPLSLKSKSATDFTRLIKHSGEFTLYGSNSYFKQRSLLNFNVTCIPDLYPGIQVTEVEDSSRNSVHYFYGVVTDDYGFSDLRFNYSIDGRTNTVMPVNVLKHVNTQEFYFSFDFAEFAGMDKAKINYFFEIFDNDEISGPKSTRSDGQSYEVPDLNTIFDYNVEVSSSVNSSLKDAEKLAGEIVSGVKELQKKMLDNNTDNWEKQQLAKDIVEKKKKLDKLLNTVKESNLKKSDLNKSFTGQDSVLIEKQKQIQDLLDKVMDDDMKRLMDEFAKLSNEFSKDKFKNLDEKMKLSFDQMSEELDRNIELLKRFQIEEKHDLISKQLDQLKDGQKKLDQLSKDESVKNDSLSAVGKDLRDDVENIKKNYQNLLKENAELSEPYSLKENKESFDKLSQEFDQQQKNMSGGKSDKKLSEQIQKDIDKLSEQMEKQQEQNFINKSLPENDIELIIQNILIISLSQEELLKQFPGVQPQSLKYNELGRLQDLKRQEYGIVKDSLSVLAKSNLMLASLLSHKFYDVEIKFGLLPGYIQDNNRNELLKEQQYIISYLNDIALSLTEALQKSKQNSDKSGEKSGQKKGSKPGDGGKGNSPSDGKEGYEGMKKFQNGLKKQLEDLVSKMKSGEKGKPLQQGIGNMIRENELFRKSLNDFIEESGSLSHSEKQLLNEINQLLDENIRDLANYSVSNQLMNRNNLIYSKLLMSEKASKEREEFEEKRKAQSATETQFKRPDLFFDAKKKSGFIKSDLKKSDLRLNSYFKTMYNNYYLKLGNE